MKKTNRNAFRHLILLPGIIIALLINSCSNETDDSIDSEKEETTAALEAAINTFTGGTSETYKIRSARLNNSTVTDLEIATLFNLKDDEFVFTTDTDGQLKMLWHEGFGFNENGTNVSTITSDTRASSKIESLLFNAENFTFVASGYNFTSTDGILTGALSLSEGAILTVELSQKITSDYLQPPTSLDTVEELFSISEGTVWSGFKGSLAQNKLYLTNFNSPSGGGDQRAFSFDLDTNTLSTFSYSQIDHPWINIEIINNAVYNVGGNTFQQFDFNFDTVIANNEIENSIWDYGSAAQDDEIYLFGGALTDFNFNEVGKYNIADGVVDIIGSLPIPTTFCDGEIVNNKLYIFGGLEDNEVSLPGPFESMIFDLENGSTEIVPIDTFLSWTSTAVVENIIYFGGTERIDSDTDGVIDEVALYIGAFDTQTNMASEIDINFDLLENERLSKLWASEEFIYLVLSQHQAGGITNLRVVRSPLN